MKYYGNGDCLTLCMNSVLFERDGVHAKYCYLSTVSAPCLPLSREEKKEEWWHPFSAASANIN